jgi:hypothetical protein
MSVTDKNFGFITMATPSDYLKAIGLALSLKVSNPGIPIAVACSKKLHPFLQPYFDYLIEEKAGLRGFVHKVYLDEYSPFEDTVFFDSDILVFKEVKPYVYSWGNAAYYACGEYLKDGLSYFGLNRAEILKKINKSQMVEIGGAGHAFFRKPDCKQIFDMAREITANYKEIAGNIAYADEDVMNIVMTKLDIVPPPHYDFHARYLSAKSWTMKMDASNATCSFIWRNTLKPYHPCMVHFAANEAPFVYTWNLYKLFKKFNVPTKGLLKMCISDAYELYIKLPVSFYLRKFKIRR